MSHHGHWNMFAISCACLPALTIGLASLLLLSGVSCNGTQAEQTEQQKMEQLVVSASSNSSAGDQAADDLARMASEGNLDAQNALFSHICDFGTGNRLRAAMKKFNVFHPMPINIPAIAGKSSTEVDAILGPTFGAGQPSDIQYSTPGVTDIEYCDGKVRITFISGIGADHIFIDAGIDGQKFQKESLTYFGFPVIEPAPKVPFPGMEPLDLTFWNPQPGISSVSFSNNDVNNEVFNSEGRSLPSVRYKQTGYMETVFVDVSGKYITMP